ncbi:glycosyl transferase family 2 [Adhaeribacter aerolatus]|uniref:Glycosyl transferase family 2 n=1 Tax=Adhaeribacter aerolatus TaxID=670289 RepID=A0A512B4Z5_9BACT|nr:glycosyltransferase [Adhaeribacter aerolatus]GEO06847.1 glycosyl transferase family 2 [Adhaeribacter aerolatus]
MATGVLYFLLCVCVLIQWGYVFYYFLPFYFYTPPLADPEQSPKPVSVIIAAHNELYNLQRLLPAVLSQQYPVFEIIVVDDRSTDGTTDYLAETQNKFRNFRYIKIENTDGTINQKKYALTQGVGLARFEYLLFTDADCMTLSNNWIGEIMSGFTSGVEMVLGYSPYRKKPGFLNHLIRFETLLSAIQYLSFSVKGRAYMGVGRNLSYTKKCFYESNGFTSHINILGGDDDLFVQDAALRHKVNIAISKESQTESIPKQTYSEWVIQKRRHLNVGRYYKLAEKLRVGIFMLSNIFFYLTAIFLLFVPDNLIFLGILFTLRSIVVYFVYVLLAQKIKEPLSVFLLPVLDLVYFLNYLMLGASVLILNKVRWK